MNKVLFDDMAAEAERWTADTGLSLHWQRRDDKRSSSIAVDGQPISFDDADARARAHTWATDVTMRMYDTLNEPLRARAHQLREGGAPVDEVAEEPDAP